MNHITNSYLYLYVLPASQSGRLADVRYTILNDDGTIHTASTNTDVVEFGKASYGISLAFPSEGRWSIHWEMVDGSYPANEEINIFDFRSSSDVWWGYPS